MTGESEADSVAVIAFERDTEAATEIATALEAPGRTVEHVEYAEGVFEAVWDRDAIVAVMASGIVVRKIAPLLEDKWTDPAVVAIDGDHTWSLPLVGGHHGANRLAAELTAVGAVPAVTTATEAAGKQAVEGRAEALDATIETPDSTVATNLAVLREALGPVERLEGPRAVLVDEDVTVLRQSGDADLVLGTGCRAETDAETCKQAWLAALEAADRELSEVAFVATGDLKAQEPGLREAAADLDLGLVTFERETLEDFEGPSPSKARELTGWPGIAEASALAGGHDHELLAEKRQFEDQVTVAIGR
ncbi:cobalamin biosynthesis protein CbiG [Halodesulfurarchaeum formicicum]|uniref:Cobalamin biosynthesis protein CbiG n=1 Tax=Halodesulfurarchaeum formicicum TaxID=1873524 RepID=A0A1D8S6Q0_9EURY|nr:cobalt-precorrin 5A hydrolase [Halodesulfurarchaeum formicicum]AOW81008.1 cobalamin biosynthesis protein CbiG [Halodesulfurarchaeum formicicum]